MNVFLERNPVYVTSQARRICCLAERAQLYQRLACHQVGQWWDFTDGFKAVPQWQAAPSSLYVFSMMVRAGYTC